MKRILILAGIAGVLFVTANAKNWIVQAAQLQSDQIQVSTPAPATPTPQVQSPAPNSVPNGFGMGMWGGRMGGMMRGQGVMNGHMGRMSNFAQSMMNNITGMFQGHMGDFSEDTYDVPHMSSMMDAVAIQDDVASMLGMTTVDMYTKMASGMSLTEIAAEKGVTEQQLKDGILTGRKAMYGQAVTQGQMTQEQADAMLKTMQDNLGSTLNSKGYGSSGWNMMWDWE